MTIAANSGIIYVERGTKGHSPAEMKGKKDMYSITQELRTQLELIEMATSHTNVIAESNYAFGMISVARNMKLMTNESCNNWVEIIRKTRDEKIKEIYS